MKQIYLKFSMLLLCLVVGLSAFADTWTRCTSVSDLTSGGTFIIGYEATANSGKITPMKNTGGTATTSAAGYMASENEYLVDMSKVTATADYEFTIVASTVVEGAICIKAGDNYIGNTNTKNNLKLFTEESATTAFGVTVGTNDVFTLKIAANVSYHTLQYNSGSPRFAVYGGTQKDLVIYKKDASSSETATLTSIAVSGTPTKTIYTEGEFFDPSGLTVTGTYSDASTASITSGINWTITPSTSLTTGTTSVSVSATVGDVTSESYTVNGLTVNSLPPLTTIDEIYTKAQEVNGTATSQRVTLNNWVVSGVSTNRKNVYVTDGTKGFIIFDTNANTGFEVGDILNGTVNCKVQLYNGSAELTELKTTTEGLTITKGGSVTPQTIEVSALSGVNTGAIISFEGLSYNGSTFSNELAPYNQLYAFGNLENGQKYNVTGVYLHFGEKKEILPRSAEDIVKVEVPKYNITIASEIENGSVSVSSSSAPEGTVITLTATPKYGYDFSSWEVTNSSTNTAITVIDNKFAMPASDVTVSATFVQIPSYIISWSVNGKVVKEETLLHGTSLTAPNVEPIDGKVFTGWVTTSTVDANSTPDYVTPSVATAVATYYAVFATGTSGSESYYKLVSTLTANNIYVFASSKTSGSAYALDGSKLKAGAANTSCEAKTVNIEDSEEDKIIKKIDADLEFRFNSDGDIDVVSSESDEKLLINGNGLGKSINNFKAYWDETKGLYGTNAKGTTYYYVQYTTQDGKFKANSGNSRVYAYEKVEGEGTSYSDYCTTVVVAPTNFTFKATNDGKNYWATFSSNRVVKFDEAFVNDAETCMAEIKAYFVCADGNEFILADLYNNYNDGNYTYIPKNTGVLMKYTLDEEYEFDGVVPFEYADDSDGYLEEVTDNNLYPSSYPMSSVEGDNYFYKLSTYNGAHVGFYWGEDNGGEFAMKNANGAYLAVPKSAGVKSLSLESLTTAIKAIENKIDINAPIYNLAGQRVNASVKGILIQNGKKFYNK